MSELDDALDWWDAIVYPPRAEIRYSTIVDAARRAANPDIDAAVASVFAKGGAGRPGQNWPIQMYPSDIARAVNVALGVTTEDNDGD